MTRNIQIAKVIGAGIAGTTAMTLVATFGAPMMGLPKMDVPGMLGDVMGGSALLGWMAHFMVGSILAVGYALLKSRLWGPAFCRGALYGVAPWLLAQILVMPMMGMGFFSGGIAPAMGSLVGHLVYGAVVGGVYGTCASCASQRACGCA